MTMPSPDQTTTARELLVALHTGDPRYGGRGGQADVTDGVLTVPPRTLLQLTRAEG